MQLREAARAAPARLDVSRHRSCRLDLAQPALEIAMALDDPLEGFSGVAGDGIWVAECRFHRDRFRDARVCGVYRRPVAEVPGFELLDGESIDHLPMSVIGSGTYAQSRRGGDFVELL